MKMLSFVVAAVLVAGQAAAQTVDLRGLDTLGSNPSGKAQTSFKEPSYSGSSRLDLSNPDLADTLSSGGKSVSGLCSAPERAGATVTNCYGLVGPSSPLPDTLR
ncbi:MAG: hypothetical protein DI537_05430 [Stutzerimonas stutzeri]|nr:MAG: hypothetical protein DI537_05430 [Stutzerimonas stutzeri]